MLMHTAKILWVHLHVLAILDTAVMGSIALVRCFLSVKYVTTR